MMFTKIENFINFLIYNKILTLSLKKICCIVKWFLYSKIQFPFLGLIALRWCITFSVFSIVTPPPPKKKKRVQLFLWLLIQDKVFIGDFLFQHDFFSLQQARCMFCKRRFETSSHLFIHRVFAWKLWMKFLFWWGISNSFPNSIDDMCYKWCKENFRIFHDNNFSFLVLHGVYDYIEMM